MRFEVLGPVAVAAGGSRLAIRSERRRTILAVLLVDRGRAVSVDRLVDALWGDAPPATAIRSLHSHVSRLRRALEDLEPGAAQAIGTTEAAYRLDPTGHEVDAERFEELLEQARDRLADPQHADTLLDRALGLWRGPAFGDLADHPAVRPEATRLEQLRAGAAADRVDARLAMGDHLAVLGELEAATATAPLDERPHAQLMVALYRSGRQADALGAYRRLQRRLADEVGIDPSPELRALHDRILRQELPAALPDGAPRAVTGGAPGRPTSSPVGGPAPAGGDFVGRDTDLLEVARRLASGRLVTLTGPGGVGKSRLAEAVVGHLVERFEQVVVSELAAVRDGAGVLGALVSGVGAQPQGPGAPEDLLHAALGDRRVLLVLDNAEHVLPTLTPLVARLMDRCPEVAVMVTSRAPLHLTGEALWEIAPLAVPPAGADAGAVAASPAGALFCARAQAADPSFGLDATTAPAVAQLCRRLDGLPLAIELAAARVRALAVTALAERIEHRFALLAGGSHRQADRHRTLRAMVDWSYALLTDREALLFDRLSVFAGRFTLPAAEEVAAGDPLASFEVAGLLAELADKSLVSVDRTGVDRRYRLLDTLRAYGAERLEAAGTAGRARARHATHHLRRAEELGARARGPDEGAALATIDHVLGDLRLAHGWLVAAGEVDAALRLPAALHDDLVFRPRAEVFAWAERSLELDGAAGCEAYPAALATAARAHLNRGDLTSARDLATAALDTDGHGSLAGLWARYVLTTTALYAGDLDAALAFADRREELAVELGDAYHRSLAGVSRVLALRYRGDDAAAVAAARDARVLAEAAGNHTARAWALYASGETLLDADPDAAAALLEQAIAAARRVDRRFIEGVALVSLASLTGRHHEPGRALARFRTAVAHWRPLGAHTQQLTTLRNLVDLLVRVGADEPAALLHGAVTVGSTPSFGAEADRLAAAWEVLERRLGRDRAEAAARRGRAATHEVVVDTALACLDGLLASDAPAAAEGGLTDEPRAP
jgi:predicted ATPase/DNA-binding SARP family transcriptional activator